MNKKSSSRSGTAPKLSDVAAAAGVSPMTVSRVINRQGNVQDDTRARVEAAIAALDYAPNPVARKLAGAQQPRVALVYGNPSRAWLGEVLMGCLAEASRCDVGVLLEKCDNAAAALAFARRADAQQFDGVILPPPFCDDPAVVAPLLAAGIAVTVLASAAPIAGTFAAMIDNRAAAHDMTRYLIGQGHRRIGFVAGDPGQTGSAWRLAGYRLALDRAGIDFAEELIARGDYSYRSGLAAAEKLLALPARPTAIFASNDDMAAAVVAAAHRRHLDVPADISVAGFDDTALATTISPELTTVRQPINDMAQAAVAMLAGEARRRRSNQRADPEHRRFRHDLVLRESVASIPIEG